MTPARQKASTRVDRRNTASRGATQNGNASRPTISALQRQRILTAMATVTHRDGYSEVTVSKVLEIARVGRRSFYELFDDREDCLLAVFDHAVSLARQRARLAYQAEHAWADRVRAGLLALLDFFDDEPELACVCLVHSFAGGPELLARRRQLLCELTQIVDGGLEVRTTTGEISPLTAEGVLGAVFSVLHTRIVQADQERLSTQLNPLMGIVVLPYLGARGAKRELSRRHPTPMRSAPQRTSLDPLQGMEMRMTYRTGCVLAAIAEAPEASNRQVGEAAGVKDPGQISKLLARLERLELVHNGGAGQAEGSANAWTLTVKGAALARALGASAGRAMAPAG
jgi:AcrR family transcriptional regulator/DNA-binding MarR family transcriptional regulator